MSNPKRDEKAQAEMIIPDAAARRSALDPEKSFIVQAPAGSGKTGLLIQRYLALLPHVTSPEEIIAITFTRKAAAEMKERVVDALKRAWSGVLTENLNAHEQITMALARKAVAQDAAYQWGIIQNPARLRICTIDSLCASLTRQMPVLSGFGMQPQIVDDARPLYRKAAEATVMELESTAYWSDSIEALVRHLDNNIGKVEVLIAEMLSRRDQWLRHMLDTSDIRLQRESLESTLCKVIEKALHRARRTMPERVVCILPEMARFAAKNLFVQSPASPVCACLEMKEIPECIPVEMEAWCGIAALLLTQNGTLRKTVDKRTGFPPGPDPENWGIDDDLDKNAYKEKKAEFKTLLLEIAGCEEFAASLDAVRQLPAPYYTEDQWDLVEALFEILKLSVAHLQLVFEKHGSVDFTEISLRAETALGHAEAPTDLALMLDYGIHHILVDEFQDTSISQFELLLRLTTGWTPGDAKTFFAVGDPMQSIYSFREAEVGLFLKAWEVGLGPHLPLEKLTLSANFRSDKGIVDWVNGTFARVFPEKSDPETGAVSYSLSEAVHPEGDFPAVRIHPVIEGNDLMAAEKVVECILSARTEIPEGKIAVLVRSRPHLKKILPALRAAGIHYKAVEIDSLGQRPVIRDLMSIVRALSHPADRVAWLALLRGPWCGLSLEDLFILAGNDHEETIYDLVCDPQRRSVMSPDGQKRLERILPVLNRAMDRRARISFRQLVEKIWTMLGGPACVSETDVCNGMGFLDFLEKKIGYGVLSDYQSFENEVTGLFSRPDPDPDEQLQVMTIHKAKGLQFETVIIPGLEKTTRGDAEKLLLWQETTDSGASAAGLLLAPIAETGTGDDPTYRFIKNLHREKAEHEIRRLIYVAATRAKNRLDLVGCAGNSKSGMPTAPPRRSLLFSLWPAVETLFCEANSANVQPLASGLGPDNLQDEGVPRIIPYISRLSGQWTAPPIPGDVSVQRSRTSRVIDVTREGNLRFDWAGMNVRISGTVIHKWLRIICETGVENWDLSRVHRVSGKIRSDLVRLGMEQNGIDNAETMVVSALSATLADHTGRWLLSPHHEGKCEYPLSGLVDNEMLYIVIDRTFIDEDAITWIVDYKSGIHGGGGLEDFMEQERLRYEKQTALYATLMKKKNPGHRIRRALYFPMFSGWCTWPEE